MVEYHYGLLVRGQFFQRTNRQKSNKLVFLCHSSLDKVSVRSLFRKLSHDGFVVPLLARGGPTALPLGLQAEAFGGSYIDKELLKRIFGKAQGSGVRWKEDPVRRMEFTESPALLRIEDA